MFVRPVHFLVAPLGYLLSVAIAGCGYTSNLRSAPEGTDIAPKGAIQHVVVIFQENVSFDHYFGTYPTALNLPGESPFMALPNTPSVEGLSKDLLQNNPNASNHRNGSGATNPFRLSPANAATAAVASFKTPRRAIGPYPAAAAQDSHIFASHLRGRLEMRCLFEHVPLPAL